jgi:acyl-CoA thioesterase-2
VIGEHEGTAGAAAVERFLSMLELERLDRDLFRGWNPAHPSGRQMALFGGQVAAHALRAATLTVDPAHYPHSLHGYFLRPGKDASPTILRVERIRDGKSFTTRTVVALQDGEAIFSLTATFHKDEPGGQFATAIADDIPMPDKLLADGVTSVMPTFRGHESPFERLEVPGYGHFEESDAPRRAMWIRARAPLPDDPGLHACVLTFVSDMGVVSAVRAAIGRRNDHGMGASLDHSVWFHRRVRADDWLLFDVSSRSNNGARGLGVGSLHTAEGVHAATVAQEALVRLPER